MPEPILWQQQPQYRQPVTKEELLVDIKTNLKALLKDYQGRGVENEARYMAEVDRMFTGGVVPSLTDWKILTRVLEELSEVKERGQMYQNFIQDVSDSLGVSDLEQIRDFIHYITTLPPDAPTVSVSVDTFPQYEVENVRATFEKDISTYHKSNRATIHWDVKEPVRVPYARVTLYDAESEDISHYELVFSGDLKEERFTFDGQSMGVSHFAQVNIPVNWTEWFAPTSNNLTFTLTVTSVDKRGNRADHTERVIYSKEDGLPLGFNNFNIQYRPTESQGWRPVFGYTRDSWVAGHERSFGWVSLLDLDGNHRFRVRGYDPGVGWSSWSESPDYHLQFRGDPPGKPVPRVTTTLNTATVTWKATPNTDYYNVYMWMGREDLRRVEANASLQTTFTGLRQNYSYNFYVEAVNEWDTNIGQTTGKTKRKVPKKKTFNALRHVNFNGQSYYNNSVGYNRPAWDGGWRNAVGLDQPHWERTYNRTSGSMFQGHWREQTWGLGYARRSGGYDAYDGQSHGNNSTFIEIDYEQLRREIGGKEIVSAEITLRREGSPHGWPNRGLPIYLYNHNQDFMPTDPLGVYGWARTLISNTNNAPTIRGLNFSRRQEHTFKNNNTRRLVENIANGHMKGFAFLKYYGSTFNESGGVKRAEENYLRFDPSRFKVTVTYNDIV